MLSKENNFSNYCSQKLQMDDGLQMLLRNLCTWNSEVCLWASEFVPSIPFFENWTEYLLSNQVYWNWELKQCTLNYEKTQNCHELITSQTNQSKLRSESDFSHVPIKTRRRNTSPPNIENNLKKILELQF